jgi:hypothetical protein
MAWNNVIPNSILLEIAEQLDKEPKQLHLDEQVFPPLFTIKEEYVTELNKAFTWVSSDGNGPSGTIAHFVDHPAFAALRKHLDAHGFIKMETGWLNGDVVTKPFYLNEVFFDIGETFFCASAMHYRLKRKQLPPLNY